MIKLLRKILVLATCITALWLGAISVYAAQFEVTNVNVRIRAEASTSSEAIGSAGQRDKFDIVGETTDSAGMVWYQVSIPGGNTGYIRSDLGRVIGGTTEGTPGDAEPIPHQEATVSTSSIRVRSGPSTEHSEVASIQRGTALVLTGKSTDSSGRVWYLMTASVGDQEVVGFVRSDLVTLGDLIEMENGFGDDGDTEDSPGASDDTTDNASTVNEQLNFEIRYIINDVGGYDYFLFDRAQGTQWKIEEFLELIRVAETNERLYSEQSDRQKTIIIILAVVIVILALVLTVLIFKIRDMHEDAEMDLRYVAKPKNTPPKKGGNRPTDANRPTANGNRPARGEKRPRRPVDGEPRATEKEEKAVRPERSEAPERSRDSVRNEQATEAKVTPIDKPTAKPASTRKPQNFLTDDDEFDFEFLNIDD